MSFDTFMIGDLWDRVDGFVRVSLFVIVFVVLGLFPVIKKKEQESREKKEEPPAP